MRRLLALFRRFGGWVHQLTQRLTNGVQQLVSATVSRLSERWHTDSIYRRTLIAAASALSATVLPHPAAAAAVGALLAGQVSTPPRSSRSFYGDEDDDFDEYPRHHQRFPRGEQTTGRRTLWETFE